MSTVTMSRKRVQEKRRTALGRMANGKKGAREIGLTNAELRQELAQLKRDCPHPIRKVRKRKSVVGVLAVEYCPDCGHHFNTKMS